MRAVARSITAAAGLVLAAGATAQTFPSRPITIVSAASPSTSGDVAVRLVANEMSRNLGLPVVVDLRTAARGEQAYAVVSKAAPDGHTVVYGTSGMLVYGNFLFKNRTFDTVKDYAPITLSFSTPQYVTINNTVPANSLQDLIALAKKNPGKLEYGTTGPGSYFHLAGEALKTAAGMDLLHVPYAQANFAQLVSDWSTGRIAVFFPTLAQIKPNQAKVKALAVFDSKRTKDLPDVPAITEVLPNYKPFMVWYGFFGPVGLPPAIAKRFADETVRAVKVPEVVAKIDALGMNIVGSSPEELAASLRQEMDTIGKLVKTIGLRPE